MARLDVDAHQAIAYMKRISMQTRCKVVDLAAEHLIPGAELQTPSATSGPRAGKPNGSRCEVGDHSSGRRRVLAMSLAMCTSLRFVFDDARRR